MCTWLGSCNVCACRHTCELHVATPMNGFRFNHLHVPTANPRWHDIFESSFKAESSELEHLFCHVSVKTNVRALSFELWKSFRKCHPTWDWLYTCEWGCRHVNEYAWVSFDCCRRMNEFRLIALYGMQAHMYVHELQLHVWGDYDQ